MEENKDYDVVINCATWALNKLAEIADYHWDGDFCKEEAERALGKIREELSEKVDVKKIPLDLLKKIRFGMWTEETILCPLYFQPILKPEADNDVRCGVIADGWGVKDGVVLWDEIKDIFDDEEDEI